jgi:hypothetical protein
MMLVYLTLDYYFIIIHKWQVYQNDTSVSLFTRFTSQTEHKISVKLVELNVVRNGST